MSTPMIVTIPHQLGVAEARRRLEGRLSNLTGSLPGSPKLTETWDGDTMRFSATTLGQTVSGRVDVRADAVVMEVVLPGVLAAIAETFKGKIARAGQLLLGSK